MKRAQPLYSSKTPDRKTAIGAALAFVGTFGAAVAHAGAGWDGYAAQCRANGGVPYPSPARCDFSGSGSGNSGYDYEAARRAREAEEARRRQEAELERQRQEAEEHRRQKEIERQAKFIRERDAAAQTLKGSIGTRITPNALDAPGLKGSVTDTGIKKLKTDRVARDVSSANAAWKQLHCAAAISSYAFAALNDTKHPPDYDEFRNLAGEALNALNGQRLGVQCPDAPPPPAAYGREGYERYAAKYKALLENARKAADDLGDARAKRKEALDRLVLAKTKDAEARNKANPKAQSEIERLRAKQQELNAMQDKKYAAVIEEQRRINAENDARMETVRQQQREINATNQKKADEMKSAMAEALAAQRAAQAEYDKQTKREAAEEKKLDQLGAMVKKLETGDPGAVSLLDQLFK